MNVTPRIPDCVPNVRGQPELVDLVRQLALVAESSLPPDEKLCLLCLQIGTALFWAERIGIGSHADQPVPGPHWAPSPAAGDGQRFQSEAGASGGI